MNLSDVVLFFTGLSRGAVAGIVVVIIIVCVVTVLGLFTITR